MIIDTHSHMDDCVYDADREQIINDFTNNNLEKIISVGCDRQGILENLELCKKYNNIYCALGIHPEYVNQYNSKIEKIITENKNNLKLVAIGEIGLDYHYENFDKELEKKLCVKQIKLAKQLNLPIIFHFRDCIEDAYELIKENQKDIIGGVMHCFSGSVEMAKKFVDMGLYLGIGGIVTFKNARHTVDVVEQIDLSHILLETDCPYLCPIRGERNEPKYTNMVAHKIAEIKNISVEEVESITTENAKKCFPKLR